MSRMAQALVLARYEDEVMEPLTRPDETRTWRGEFTQIPGWFVGGWYLEFFRSYQRHGLLADLEALPWKQPYCLQVMLHDEDDDCFGLWMFHDGALVEVPIARVQRVQRVHTYEPGPGYLCRTDEPHFESLAPQSPDFVQDPRLSW